MQMYTFSNGKLRKYGIIYFKGYVEYDTLLHVTKPYIIFIGV